MRRPMARLMISIVTPAFNEAENLPVALRAPVAGRWTPSAWTGSGSSSTTTRGTRRSRSSRDWRSAIRGCAASASRATSAPTPRSRAGCTRRQGDCVAALAADLQDPPEVIPELLEQWKAGVKVVWAARASREGEKVTTVGFSRLYYWLMRQRRRHEGDARRRRRLLPRSTVWWSRPSRDSRRAT